MHAVQTFQTEDTEAILLVDARNAFNSLNRQTALHNIQRLCPSLAPVLINTYRAPTELYVDGDVLYSKEGTTQGDPLAMPMYALATISLIRYLNLFSGIASGNFAYIELFRRNSIIVNQKIFGRRHYVVTCASQFFTSL